MRYLSILLILYGCAAIQVSEEGGTCTVSGTMLETDGQSAPVMGFKLAYEGDRCAVRVSNVEE